MCTKTEGENSKMDKGKCAQRRKERTQRLTKENVHKDTKNVHKDTRRELTNGQRKMSMKTQ
jgi:hypothetical protein